MPTIKKLIYYDIENLFSVTKKGFRSISDELTLPFGADISKEDLIKNISNVMINEEENSMYLILALIEKEEEDKDVI